jgi:dihydropteroate synthase
VSGSTIFPPDRVTIVAALNVTPDSFSDGGRFVDARGRVDVEEAVAAGRALAAAGAHVLDVGGESTRPGSAPVPAGLEIARVRPVLEGLAKATGLPLSVDTRKAEVAEAALEAGASIVNDVSGLRDPRLAEVVAAHGAGLVLGHLRGEPATMQERVHFDDVLAEVADELAAAVARARAAGVPAARLAVDPGLGFGKRLRDNLALLARVGELRARLGLPVLVGPSRKSFLGELTGDPPGRRLAATLAACAVGVFAGADAVRVHDVEDARRAVAVARALREAAGAAP